MYFQVSNCRELSEAENKYIYFIGLFTKNLQNIYWNIHFKFTSITKEWLDNKHKRLSITAINRNPQTRNAEGWQRKSAHQDESTQYEII